MTAESTLLDFVAASRASSGSWSDATRVSVTRKYMCVAVPKVACSTLKLAVHTFEDPTNEIEWWETHADWPGWCALNHPDDVVLDMLASPDWFRFCFVRNPYDRLVSAWKSKVAADTDHGYGWLRDAISKTFGRPVDQIDPTGFRNMFDYVTGEDFVAGRDWHWVPQSTVLHPDVIPYDVVGRFENFADDFRRVFEKLDAPEKVLALADTRHNATPATDFRDFYDADLAARVYAFYERDFTTFGYERDSWRHMLG